MITIARIHAAMLAMVGLFLCAGPAFANGDDKTISVGSKVGGFTLTDTQGKTHNIADFKGKIVVLEWINPHCPVSERTYTQEIMQPLQKSYTEKGIVWLLVNSTNAAHDNYEPSDKLHSIYAEWKSSPTAICLDADGTIGRMFQAKTTPHMYVIDQSQTLVYAGALDDDPRGSKDTRVNYVAKALDELLAGAAISTSATQPYGCSVKYKK